MNPWKAACRFAAEIRADWAEGITGRRWHRPVDVQHPHWCARGHHCTAGARYPSGEHRSDPIMWQDFYGVLQAVRVETVTSTPRMMVTADVKLPTDEQTAHQASQRLLVGVDLLIRAVLDAVPDSVADDTELLQLATAAGVYTGQVKP